MSAEPAEPAEPDLPTLAAFLNAYMAQGADWTPPPDPPPAAPARAPGAPAPAPVIRLARLAELPAPAWLIEHILPQNALGCVYGAPGAGKTFLALDWALAVATGRPWDAHATRPGAVLYVAAEGH